MNGWITIKKGYQTIGTYVCNNHDRKNNRCNIDREDCSIENMKHCFEHYPDFFEEVG